MPTSIPADFGPYRILELIERVGGTHICLARQASVDRLVTLTVLPPQSAQHAAFTKRFQRQVLAASRLSHPNIVRALDAGAMGEFRYIAAEYAGGQRLSLALEKGEWFPLRRCISIALDIARALEHLQTKDIVHRALTPRTVVLAESGVAKLRSFSLSKPLEGAGSETWFDVDAYAAQYMAPELVRFTEDVDGRADIYSLGCVLYHLLTGEAPFAGATSAETMKLHAAAAVPDPRTHREDVPGGLTTILERCLAKECTDRFATATDLVEALEAVQAGRKVRTRSWRPTPLRWLAALFRNPE